MKWAAGNIDEITHNYNRNWWALEEVVDTFSPGHPSRVRVSARVSLANQFNYHDFSFVSYLWIMWRKKCAAQNDCPSRVIRPWKLYTHTHFRHDASEIAPWTRTVRRAHASSWHVCETESPYFQHENAPFDAYAMIGVWNLSHPTATNNQLVAHTRTHKNRLLFVFSLTEEQLLRRVWSRKLKHDTHTVRSQSHDNCSSH